MKSIPECDNIRSLVSSKDDFVKFRQQALALGIRTREGLYSLLQKEKHQSQKGQQPLNLQAAIQTSFETDRTFEYIERKRQQRLRFQEYLRKEKEKSEKRKKEKEEISKEKEEIPPERVESPITKPDFAKENLSSEDAQDFELPSLPTVTYRVYNNPLGRNVSEIFEIRELKQQGSISRSTEINGVELGQPLGNSEPIKVVDGDSVRLILRSILCMFLIHQGFQSVEQDALNLFTDIIDAYMLKFGKVLNGYSSLNTNNSSFRESLLKTMQEMGLQSVEELPKLRSSVENHILDTHNRLMLARKKVEHHIKNKDKAVKQDREQKQETPSSDEESDEGELNLITSSLAFGRISDIMSGSTKRGVKRKNEQEEPEETVTPIEIDNLDAELVPSEECASKESSKQKKIRN